MSRWGYTTNWDLLPDEAIHSVELIGGANPVFGLSTLGGALKDDPALAVFYEAEDQAYDMILGDGAKAFDLSQEDPKLRSRYGHPAWSETSLLRFGQTCLAARRLVERGVPYVTINHGGWDTHTDLRIHRF